MRSPAGQRARAHFQNTNIAVYFQDECEECQLLQARIETLACKNKGRINVARVNKGTTGAVTGRRFEVGAVPSLIL